MMIYFDNASTTSVISEAAEAAVKIMCNDFGNPSSLHGLGLSAENEVKKTRLSLAEALGCAADELVFTSCGTESNNFAIFGAAERSGRKRHIVTTSIEHPSVLNAVKKLQSRGYDVTYVEPGEGGAVCAKDVVKAVREDTFLVSVMSVNNEVGSVMDISAISHAVHSVRSDIVVHTDAVQAFLKVPFNARSCGADLISVSGHKIHAPKGVGALYIKKGISLAPLLCGGGQERGMRSGTEAVPQIAAFGVAIRSAAETNATDIERMSGLRNRLIEGLSGFDNVHLIMPVTPAPHILCASFMKYPSEVTMRVLEENKIYISSGSACSRGKKSHVLKALRVPSKILESAVRISLSRLSTEREVDEFLEVVKQKLI